MQTLTPLTSTILRSAAAELRMAGRAKDGVLRSRRSREGGPLLKDENEQYEFEKQMKRQESHVLRLHS